MTTFHCKESEVRVITRIGLGVLLLTSIVVGTYTLRDPEIFPIRVVKITGEYPHVDQATIKKTIFPFLKESFLFLDTAGLQESLQRISWIHTITLKRTWPDTLVVQVEEQVPVARWQGDQLVTASGDLFTPSSDTMPADLPVINAPRESRQAVMAGYQEMSAALNSLGLKINVLEVWHDKWSLQLNNGLRIVLGRSQLGERFVRFVKVYPGVVASHVTDIDTVDLRYANGLVLRWKNQG